MKFIELTGDDGVKILINLSLVSYIEPCDGAYGNGGCIINFNNDDNFSVLEEYDEVKQLVISSNREYNIDEILM